MKATYDRHESGWTSITLCLQLAEIDSLIRCLQDLKAGSINHFHFTQEKWAGESGIADIEISIKGSDAKDNMRLV